MKILVIEDELQMLDNIVRSLKQEQYIVETADNFDSAIEKVGVYEYDCILLDISLPGGSGLQILEKLKKEKKTEGVIIISAKNSLDDKVEGLNLGADDYIPKPFHLVELNARIKSVLRRRKFNGSSIIEISNLKIDAENRTIIINDVPLNLNRKEFDVLLYLAINKNRLVNKTALAEHVWGDYIDETNSFDFIYSQLRNLKKKLKDANAQIELQAIYGMGYKLVTS